MQVKTPELSVAADPELLAQGWERRHMAATQQAKEAEKLYTSLGFEVRLESLSTTAFSEKCQSCASVVCRSYVLVYTRKIEDSE